MAFEQKTWTDRLSEYPTRRQLTKSDGSTEIVDVARLEGTISQEGDAFSAENMNNLEQRIADEFSALNNALGSVLEWKKVATVTNKTTITLPTEYNEIMVCSLASGGTYLYSKVANKDAIDNGRFTYIADGFNDSYKSVWTVTKTTLALYAYVHAGSDYSSNTTTTVYYR